MHAGRSDRGGSGNYFGSDSDSKIDATLIMCGSTVHDQAAVGAAAILAAISGVPGHWLWAARVRDGPHARDTLGRGRTCYVGTI